MMALIYAIQGAWWPIFALHLADMGFTGRERGWIFATYPIAAIVTSLGAGALVDRRMASQHYLALCAGISTIFLLAMAFGWLGTSIAIFALMMVYWLITAPTYGIAASIALRNLRNPQTEFGRIRLWGTIGWMLVGWLVSFSIAWFSRGRTHSGAFEAFWIASALSAVFAVFSLFLPHTPPLATRPGAKSLAGAMQLIRTPAVGVYLITAFMVALTTPFVFQAMPPYLESLGLSRAWTPTVLTAGQVPEIIALAVMPFFMRRFGYKVTLGLGLLAWLVRFGTLSLSPPLWIALGGIPLHGIGIACFTVGGQVFLDSRAADDRRASAQALNTTVTSGLGALLGSLLSGELQTRFEGNYAAVFQIPCLIHVGLIVFFIMGFRPSVGAAGRLASRLPVPLSRRDSREETRSVAAAVRPYAMESADG